MDLVKYTRDSSFQRIKAWYIDENSVQLSPKDEQLKSRLMHIWSLRFREKYSRAQVIQIVIKHYDISQATAYRNYALAQELFGEIDAVNVAAERLVIGEALWELYREAKEEGDIKSAVRALEKYLALFPETSDADKVDPRKLEASQYIMQIPRGTSDILNRIITGGVVDFNTIEAEDVEFKEVADEEEE